MNRKFISARWLVDIAIVVTLCAMTGCNSKSSPKVAANKTKAPAVNSKEDPGVIGADYCLQTFMKTPVPAPVHFAYKRSDSEGVTKSFDGDLTANTMDLTFFSRQPADPDLVSSPGGYKVHDGVADLTDTSHYTRSDEHQWTMAPTMPVQSATPWSEFLAKPSIQRTGQENINGFDTIKYTVDTTHQDSTDKAGARMGLNANNYDITGTVWVAKDGGCILQWLIDSQTDFRDGKVNKTHYEGSISKK